MIVSYQKAGLVSGKQGNKWQELPKREKKTYVHPRHCFSWKNQKKCRTCNLLTFNFFILYEDIAV